MHLPLRDLRLVRMLGGLKAGLSGDIKDVLGLGEEESGIQWAERSRSLSRHLHLLVTLHPSSDCVVVGIVDHTTVNGCGS